MRSRRGHFCRVGDLVRDPLVSGADCTTLTRIALPEFLLGGRRGFGSSRPSRSRRPQGTTRRSVARVDHRDVVGVKPRVSRHQRESFMERLGDEEAVERITMMQRKARDGEAMVRGQSEHT